MNDDELLNFLYDNNKDLLVKDIKKNKLLIKCLKCGKEFKIKKADIIINCKCRMCEKIEKVKFKSKATSKQEKEIEIFLLRNNIQFEEQYRIKDCRNIKPLPFDFAIFNNNKLKCLVEVQGEQHYKSVKHMGGKDEYESRIKNDLIKKEYCERNKIKLIVIDNKEKDKEYYLANKIIR